MAREPDPAKPDPAKPDPEAGPEAAPGPAPFIDTPVREAILRLCAAAGPGRSVDPSTVARELGGRPEEVVPWRALLRRIRAETVALQEADRVVVLRKGKPVDIRAAKGVLRLALAEGGPSGDAQG